MTKISEDPKFAIMSSPSCTYIAGEIAKTLEKNLIKCKIGEFPNGDPDILIKESVRGKTVFFIQTSLTGDGAAAKSLFQTQAVADALYRAGCSVMYLIQLNFPAARQDRREYDSESESFKSKRRPITAKVTAETIENAGIRGIVTFHLHSGQIEGFFTARKCFVENISPASIFIEFLKESNILNGSNEDLVLIAPDVGGAAFVSFLSKVLRLPPYVIIDKRRYSAGNSEVVNIIGNVQGKRCILWDDMVDSGGTMVKAAKKVLEQGATEVILIATHAVLSGNAEENLLNSPFVKIIFSDTLPLPVSFKNDSRFIQLSVGPMLARVIANLYNDESLEEIVRINIETEHRIEAQISAH